MNENELQAEGQVNFARSVVMMLSFSKCSGHRQEEIQVNEGITKPVKKKKLSGWCSHK